MSRMLYIPTDRRCLPAITSGLKEAQNMSADAPCWFALIEHWDAPYVREHAHLLRRTASARGDRILHVTPSMWTAFLAEVLRRTSLRAGEREKITSMHLPRVTAYGVGPNKAALLAASANVGYLHRRDSDQVPDTRDGKPCIPCEPEVWATGRTVADVANRWQVDDTSTLDDEQHAAKVHLTGSALIGDVSLDRRDLDEVDPSLSARVHALAVPDASLEQLVSRLQTKYQRDPNVRYDTDFFQVDTTGSTEMGISCIADCFLHLPEMPMRETLATDYTIKNLLYQLGSPVLFHSRKMIHVYEDQRRVPDERAAARYALRDLRYMILRRVRADLNSEIKANPGRIVDRQGIIDGAEFAARYADHLDAVLPEIKDIPGRYAAVYAEAASRAAGTAALRLAAAHDAVIQAGDEPVTTVIEGIRDFRWLAERWTTLINAAAEVHLTTYSITRWPA